MNRISWKKLREKKKKSKVSNTSWTAKNMGDSSTAWPSHNQTCPPAEDARGAEESLGNLAKKQDFLLVS